MGLQFASNADSQDILSEVRYICGTDVNGYATAAITRRCNFALDRAFFMAITSNGLWQFDDENNNNNLPIGTTNIFSGQQDYQFASDVLVIERVLAKDSNGNWKELEHVNINDGSDQAQKIWELPSGNSGSPTHYDSFANSVLLDPIPNYNSSSGLKVVFQRGPTYFDTDDDTKNPGIPSIFHSYICRYAALQWLIEKMKPSAAGVAAMVAADEAAIKEFFAFRSKDPHPRLNVRVENTR